jgi:hypothetical protein
MLRSGPELFRAKFRAVRIGELAATAPAIETDGVGEGSCRYHQPPSLAAATFSKISVSNRRRVIEFHAIEAI